MIRLAPLFIATLLSTNCFAQQSITSLPQIGAPASNDLIVVERVGVPIGQRTSAITAQNLSAYVSASLIGIVMPGPTSLPSCTTGSSVAPVPTGHAFQCGGLILIAQ